MVVRRPPMPKRPSKPTSPISPHQPEPPPPLVVVVPPVVVVVLPAAGEAAGEAFVVVVVVVDDADVAAAAGLAAGLACASAIAGIRARALASAKPAAPLLKAFFICRISLLSGACTGLLTRSARPTDGTAGCFRETTAMLQTPIVLDDVRKDPARVLAAAESASLLDLDDGVLCLEFHSKGNTLDGDTLTVAEHAFAAIPGRYKGLVVGNQGKHFSFGANLRWLLALLQEIGGDRERFHVAAKRFQRITTGMRTVPFPTVSAPFELTIGGALELTMYADRVQAHAGMRASLPEIAVGILPDLGGTSELYIRCIDAAGEGNEAAGLRDAFQTIVFMRSSKDAEDARTLRFLKAHDRITADLPSLVSEAKARVLELARDYVTPAHRTDVPVLGDAGYDALNQAIDMAAASGMATPYDAEVARAIARVMTGGPGPARRASHEELLDLETQYFETLVFNDKTKERMEYMLEHGAPLRN